MIRALLCAASMLGLAGPLAAQAGETRHVLIVTGVSGEPQYADRFDRAGAALVDVFRGPLALAADRVHWLAEDPARDPIRIGGRSTRAEVERALGGIASRAAAADLVVIFFIGHGTHAAEARFNVPGPDLTPADMATLLAPLSKQTVVFVNAASASGEFVAPLSGPRRVILTATKSGFERNETLFIEEFIRGLADAAADTDKDGRVSVLEAFRFAIREVARRYESTNRLQTEHALLDDDGDGKGSTAPTGEQGDGVLARGISFAPPAAAMAGADTLLRRLLGAREALERDVAALRAEKDQMPEAEYQMKLEALLVQLAETSAAIKAREGARP